MSSVVNLEAVYRSEVSESFDVGHGAYIETATGTEHMYFLLGTESSVINKGMRCKDYLQEVFLAKKKKRLSIRTTIYGYPMVSIRAATKLFLKFPAEDMTDYTENVYKCINYINTTYKTKITVAVFIDYIQLDMGDDWFTDSINSVEASVICTFLRSCLIWKYDSYIDMRNNIDDIEDEYESVFPEKDWSSGVSKEALDYLGNTKAHSVMGKWINSSKYLLKRLNTEYHNSSGWRTAFNALGNLEEDALLLLDKLKPSTSRSDQCILCSIEGKLLYPKVIKNSKDFRKALKKKHVGSLCLIFNNANIGRPFEAVISNELSIGSLSSTYWGTNSNVFYTKTILNTIGTTSTIPINECMSWYKRFRCNKLFSTYGKSIEGLCMYKLSDIYNNVCTESMSISECSEAIITKLEKKHSNKCKTRVMGRLRRSKVINNFCIYKRANIYGV